MVLRRWVFSLFIPLKLRSAAQVETRAWGFSLGAKVISYRSSSHLLNNIICSLGPQKKKKNSKKKKTPLALCLSECVNSEVQNTNDCVVHRRAVKNSRGPLRKRNQGRCCDWCISFHFVFALVCLFVCFLNFAIVVVVA